MKTFSFILVLFISIVNSGFSQKNRIAISDFQDHRLEYTLKELHEDTICGIPKSETIVHCIAIDNISTIEIIRKNDRRFSGTILGIGIGVVPGLLILGGGNKSGDALEGIGRAIVFFPVTIGGAIVGGIIGYQLGRKSVTTIPIYGNKKLYDKQKDKLKKYLY